MNSNCTENLRSNPDGLSALQAGERLRIDGYNELPRTRRRTPFLIVLEVLREPMLALLLAGGLLYLLLGDLKEAIILLVFATFSIVITAVQESRTERALEALRDLTSPRAVVIRDGERLRIAGREVVRGDLLVISEGDRIAADAVLVEAIDLQTDESLLTGESVPVRKRAHTTGRLIEPPAPGGDDLPYVFSGSLVVRGTGLAEVIATGQFTEIGKIGHSLQSLESEAPRLNLEMRRVVRLFAVLGAAVSVAVVLLYGFLRGAWLDAFLAGITVGMSMLPEEFQVVLTVFMAMGAWRISQARVLTRRASAIEALGSATVLCTDKTGTLTENRMSVSELRLASGVVLDARHLQTARFSEAFRAIIHYGVLASARQPVDPMESALHRLQHEAPPEVSDNERTRELELLKTYGLRAELLSICQVWATRPSGEPLVIAAKGAPEAVAEICHLSPFDRATLQREVEDMAEKGLRVLAVARGTHSAAPLPESQHDFQFTYLGLVGFSDPLRKSVPDAVRECRSAGVRVVMITGDYPATAKAIAGDAGLDAGSVMLGTELAKVGEAEVRRKLRNVGVFARIVPDQKLRIVSALKGDGEIVAMTGDGVNDAPALKAAHIGIAMGQRGTDVAREASSIVLLDDDFGSIVKTIRLGRRIYDNLRKAAAFIFAVHLPIAGLALLPLALGMPPVLGPVHIALLEMIIDPVCSLVFEAEDEERDIMRRRPRPPDEPLFTPVLIGWSLLQGVVACAAVAFVFVAASRRGLPETDIRALGFFSLVAVIIALIFVNRSFSSSLGIAIMRPNRTLILVIMSVVLVLAVSVTWSPARELLAFGVLHTDDVLLTLSAGAVVLVLLEAGKKFLQRGYSFSQ